MSQIAFKQEREKVKEWRRYPAYKDSGVEWLGEIPSHWEVKRLKNATLLNLDTLNENTHADYLLTYIDIGNVTSDGSVLETQEFLFEKAPSRARRKVKDGDTIISTVRTYLRAISLIEDPPENLIVSTGFAVLTPSSEIEPQFLFRLVQSSEFVEKVVAHSEGVGYPAINPSKLACLPIWLPPLPEQQAIAQFLDRETTKIDTLVAKKERLIELLKEKRTALISHAVTKGLNPDAPMKDSGVEWWGEVPKGWEIMPIKFALSIPITDGPHETPELYDEGIPFISAESIKNDQIDFDKKRGYISLEEHKRFSRKYKPQYGDVYMVKSGATTGNVARVETNQEFNIWSPLAVLRPNTDVIKTNFLFYAMKSKPFFYSVELSWSFGTQQNIGMGVISNIRIVLPPPSEQQAIAQFLDRETAKIDTLIAKTRNSIEKLKEYRTALISAAVTGKIDVRND